MTRLTDQARAIFHQDMAAAMFDDTAEARWNHLERAHIVSQPGLRLHTRNHAAMLALALRHNDRREAVGQLMGSSSEERKDSTQRAKLWSCRVMNALEFAAFKLCSAGVERQRLTGSHARAVTAFGSL